MHIVDKPISKRTAVTQQQAELFALLIRDLQQAYGRQRGMSNEHFWQLPEYRRFLLGAYACGFVCRDISPDNRFQEIQARPQQYLSRASFRQLRIYAHTLLRAERWADGYSSPVQEALDSGALDILASRLESDESLREPDIILVDELE